MVTTVSVVTAAWVVVLALGSSSVVYAFWGAPGSGLGLAAVGSVSPPATVTISSFGPTATVTSAGSALVRRAGP